MWGCHLVDFGAQNSSPTRPSSRNKSVALWALSSTGHDATRIVCLTLLCSWVRKVHWPNVITDNRIHGSNQHQRVRQRWYEWAREFAIYVLYCRLQHTYIFCSFRFRIGSYICESVGLKIIYSFYNFHIFQTDIPYWLLLESVLPCCQALLWIYTGWICSICEQKITYSLTVLAGNSSEFYTAWTGWIRLHSFPKIPGNFFLENMTTYLESKI